MLSTKEYVKYFNTINDSEIINNDLAHDVDIIQDIDSFHPVLVNNDFSIGSLILFKRLIK